jgi:hypothetical protein
MNDLNRGIKLFECSQEDILLKYEKLLCNLNAAINILENYCGKKSYME